MLFKLCKIYLYKSAKTLEDTLDELEVSDETREYILNNSSKANKYIAILQDFSDADPEELEALLYKNEPSKGISNKEMVNSNIEKVFNIIKEEGDEEKVKNAETIIKLDIPMTAKPWALKQVYDNYNVSDITGTLKYFFRNITHFEKRDVNQYENIKELEKLTKEISSRRNSKVQGNIDPADAPIVWENEDFLLFRPENKQACITTGVGTEWCITMEDATYYEDYTKKNVLFYFLMRKNRENDSLDKVAFAIGRDANNQYVGEEIFDQNDDSMSLGELKDHFGDIVDQIHSVILSDSVNHSRSMVSKINSGNMTSHEWASGIVSDYMDKSRQRGESFDLDDYELGSVSPEYISNLFYLITSELGISTLAYDFEGLMDYLSDEDIASMEDDWDELDYLSHYKPQIIGAVDPDRAASLFEDELKNNKDPDDENIFYEIAASAFGNMYDEDLVKYINNKDEYLRVQVAKNIGEEYLFQMMKDPSDQVKAAVASKIDPKYLPEMLQEQGELPFNKENPKQIDSKILAEVIKRIDSRYLDFLINKYGKRTELAYNFVNRLPVSDERLEKFTPFASPQFSGYKNIQYDLLEKLPVDKLHMLRNYFPEHTIADKIRERSNSANKVE